MKCKKNYGIYNMSKTHIIELISVIQNSKLNDTSKDFFLILMANYLQKNNKHNK